MSTSLDLLSCLFLVIQCLNVLTLENMGLDIFDWVIVGYGCGAIGTKTYQPKKAWVESLHKSARKAGCMIYDMPFLRCKRRDHSSDGVSE